MENIREKLLQKGWKKKHVNEAIKIFENAKKHPQILLLDKFVYWFSLLIAILGNFIISVSLIPSLLTLHSAQLYLVIITIGVSFGLLFELLISTLSHLETKHHLLLSFIVPLIAISNIFAIVLYSNRLEALLQLDNYRNPAFIAITYAISFMLPYFLYQFLLKK